MGFYSAYIKYVQNNQRLDKTCTVSDKKYDEACIPFQHGDTTYYIKSSEFDNKKVKITYWNF